MYQRILVAVDGSPTSNLALNEALQLAREQKAQLHLVHVVDVSRLLSGRAGFVDSGTVEKAMVLSGREVLDAATSACMGSGVETDRALIEIRRNGHDVADALTAEAKSSHSDLLAIGTHGHREMGDFFMGSVAEGVIRTSPVPVLVVRGH